jgi:hypothetical protein
MNKKSGLYSIASLLLVLPGCGRVVDWAKGNFNQGTSFKKNTQISKAFIRSVTVYDQFTTSGMFDALYLSDQVRTLYAQLHARRYGKSDEQYKIFLRRQLEENNHFISFFILTPYEAPLGKKDDKWAVFLNIDGDKFSPIELKTIELSPEFQFIFGKRFNRFKVAHIAKFDANTVEDKLLIDANTKNLALYFRSTDKQAELKWTLNTINNINEPIQKQG